MSIKVKGLNKVLRNLLRLSKNSQRAYKDALSDEADIIFGKSLRLVPVALDGGILRSTGHVDIKKKGDAIIATIIYGGGPAKSYAIVQHETKEFRHRGIQQWRYLKQPFDEAQPGMTNRLANRVKKVL